MSDTYKPQATSSLFPEEFRLEKLSKQGDPLERLDKSVDWDKEKSKTRARVEHVFGFMEQSRNK